MPSLHTAIRLLVPALALVIASISAAQISPQAPSTTASAQGETIELTPFTVSADSDVGWVASASLAGSRLNTPLRDTGASISVLTSEFLADLGAIDIGEAIEYSVNTAAFINADDNRAMEHFPQFNIRGIPATVTRNYFKWKLQTDSYNVDRIEENRGPNSILFGIGSAGGIINAMTKQASFSRDFRRASLMGGSHDSYRGTVDLNQRYLDGALAVRVNAVYSEMGSHRQHVFQDTQRIHLAAAYQVRPATRLRFEYEGGRIEQVSARNIAAYDQVTRWLDAGSPLFATTQTANLSALGLIRLRPSAPRVTYIGNTGAVYNMQGTNVSSGTTRAILDQSLAAFSISPSGPGQKREADLQNFGVFWEERLGDNTFMEIAHNFQWSRSTAYMSGQGRRDNAALFADPHLFLPDGSPNPYAGGLMFEGDRWNRIKNWDRSHSTRAQVSHELDAGRWGNYRFALMGEYEWRSNRKHIDAEVWEGAPFHAIPENFNNYVYRRFYVTPGDWSTYYATGAGYTGLLQNVPDPTNPSRTLNSAWRTFNQGGRSNPHEYQRTVLIGGQARYFDGRLVAGVGLRRDKLDLKAVRAVRDPVTNEWTLEQPDIIREFYGFHGTTRTLGVVGHVNRQLSLFYNFSNSLDVPNTQHRVLPEGQPPSPPDARGQDFGLALSFLEGRLVARANAFEVDLVNVSGAGFGGTFSNPRILNNDVLNALLAVEAIPQGEADARTFISNNAMRDRRLEGYEFNLTGSITPNWRMTFSYSYTDGFDSAIAPEIKAWAAETLPWFLQWPDVVTSITDGDGELMTVAQRVALWEKNAGQEWLREGDLILGNRKHKYSIYTRYSLTTGPLNGAYIGGGYRHQSKAPIGFDSNRNLQYNGSYWEADMLLGYRLAQRRFFKNGLNLQLNIKNLFDDQEPMVTQFSSSGQIERIAIRAPRTWRLTASFDF